MLTTFTPSHRGGSGTPMVCLHGFTDTWRTWELVLPALEREHDVLAPTLPGHAGGPPLEGDVDDALADGVERAMDAAGFDTAHIVGNSLGGYVALKLAERGRARTVVALAPAGGWALADDSHLDTLDYFEEMQELLKAAVAHVELIVTSPEGRRRATQDIVTNYDHIPSELIAHMMLGAASCPGFEPLIEHGRSRVWNLDAERVACPVRVVWGTDDRVLAWPESAARYRGDWLPNADWVELDGIGHGPQLDVPTETAQLVLEFAAP
ncbi:MAG TPA: alpha/beta fold hydrolase [Solirubrobacterales bacterium]